MPLTIISRLGVILSPMIHTLYFWIIDVASMLKRNKRIYKWCITFFTVINSKNKVIYLCNLINPRWTLQLTLEIWYDMLTSPGLWKPTFIVDSNEERSVWCSSSVSILIIAGKFTVILIASEPVVEYYLKHMTYCLTWEGFHPPIARGHWR